MASASREYYCEPDWILAKHGIKLFINNKAKEAEELFMKYPESLVMFSGYSYVVFMDALMSFEEEKLAKAISTLKEVEKRCSNHGWFRYVRNKMFGTVGEEISIIESLETQIILADSQVCLAILVFLQQDISGYLKAGWVLRKAWKVYETTYADILNLYNTHIGPLNLPDPTQISSSSDNVINVEKEILTNENDLRKKSLISQKGYTKRSNSNQFPCSQSESSNLSSLSSQKNVVDNTKIAFLDRSCLSSDSKKNKKKSSSSFRNSMRKSFSVNGALSKYNDWTTKFGYNFTNSMSFHYLTSALEFFNTQKLKENDEPKIEKKEIIRLMNAVTFGYGLFELGVSLLPPALLKLTSFLGLSGNRMHGLACLMYSRLGIDMRAPLATLSLLWFHCIVRPFYAIDGANVSAGTQIADHLIKESNEEFGDSSIFLFFLGRLCRLNSEIPAALKAFQSSVQNATQREIKFLALHDVGWCYLIQLDYYNAERNFSYLSAKSRWSKPFYCYISCICKGSLEGFTDYTVLEEFIANIRSSSRTNQLDEFLMKRASFFPTQDNFALISKKFWRILVYEMLYLWNALPSCTMENIFAIIEDCNLDSASDEPMKGAAKFIQGVSYVILKKPMEAKDALTQSIECRSDINEKNCKDSHILAFAQYELASILIATSETRVEGKKLLQQTIEIRDYDFEERLAVRVSSLLRNTTD